METVFRKVKISERLPHKEGWYACSGKMGMHGLLFSEQQNWDVEELQEMEIELKNGELLANITDRKEFLDSLADQVVTAVGAGYCAGMKTADAVAAVNRSNYSKFDKNGYPIFNKQGKIAKGADYAPPNLEGMY
jgi:hypothetical protein